MLSDAIFLSLVFLSFYIGIGLYIGFGIGIAGHRYSPLQRRLASLQRRLIHKKEADTNASIRFHIIFPTDALRHHTDGGTPLGGWS